MFHYICLFLSACIEQKKKKNWNWIQCICKWYDNTIAGSDAWCNGGGSYHAQCIQINITTETNVCIFRNERKKRDISKIEDKELHIPILHINVNKYVIKIEDNKRRHWKCKMPATSIIQYEISGECLYIVHVNGIDVWMAQPRKMLK